MLACLQQRSLEGNSQNKTLGFKVLGFFSSIKESILYILGHLRFKIRSKLNIIIFGDFSLQILHTKTLFMEMLCILHLNNLVNTFFCYIISNRKKKLNRFTSTFFVWP